MQKDLLDLASMESRLSCIFLFHFLQKGAKKEQEKKERSEARIIIQEKKELKERILTEE